MNESLSEADAVRIWALAYNTHEPAVLEPILADEVRVTSRWVINDLVGREAYLEYLRAKFETFEAVGSAVRVEVAAIPAPAGRPCALLEQDGSLIATVLLEVDGGFVSRVSMGDDPAPTDCDRSGCFPGFDEGVAVLVN